MRDVVQVRAFHNKTICRQNAVVGVHRKRNPFGIVVKPTAQRGLLLGMCSELVLRSIFALICRQNAVDTTLGEKSQRWIVLKRTAIAGIFC